MSGRWFLFDADGGYIANVPEHHAELFIAAPGLLELVKVYDANLHGKRGPDRRLGSRCHVCRLIFKIEGSQ